MELICILKLSFLVSERDTGPASALKRNIDKQNEPERRAFV